MSYVELLVLKIRKNKKIKTEQKRSRQNGAMKIGQRYRRHSNEIQTP
jgi:hypothetical protein